MWKNISIKKIKLKHLLILFSIMIFLSLFLFQLKYINPYASTWDQVDFALAISRYDLLAMQPHFPGYPYFILGGKLFAPFFDNPAKALTLFNICLFATTIYPIYQLGKQYLSKEKSLLLSVILYSSCYIVLVVNQPVSEGAAISILCWYVWSLAKSFRSKNKIYILVSLFLLSILFGIRLSYLPFAIGIIYLFYIKWKTKSVCLKKILLYSLLGILFQFAWVLAISLTEGSLTGFIKLALSFTSGHFNDWGGSVGSNSLPLLERIYYFIVHNILWTGFFTQSKTVMILFVIILLYLLFFIYKEKFPIDHIHILVLLLNGTYFIWALLAQNIDKPRHIIPFVLISIFIVFLLFLQKSKKFGLFLVCLFLVVQYTHAIKLIKEQATQLPATYQLAKFLEEKKEPIIVYTWEETRVLEYLNATFPHKRVLTYKVFKLDSSYYTDYDILLTDKVLLGFENQGINLQNQVEKIAEFRSKPLMDPVYNHITLYKWKKQKAP